MEKSWQQIDEEADALYEKQMEEAKLRSSADFDYFYAAQRAKRQTRGEDLFPYRTKDGDLKYTVAQGIRAACLTREEVIALTHIQRSLLLRLSGLRKLLWSCIVLLCLVAGKLILN